MKSLIVFLFSITSAIGFTAESQNGMRAVMNHVNAAWKGIGGERVAGHDYGSGGNFAPNDKFSMVVTTFGQQFNPCNGPDFVPVPFEEKTGGGRLDRTLSHRPTGT